MPRIARSLFALAAATALIASVSACVKPAGSGASSAGSAAPSAPPAPAETTSAAPATPAPKPATPPPATYSEGGAIGTPVVPSGKSKPGVGAISRPSDAAVISHAKKLLGSDQGVVASAIGIEAATQDAKGHWWILLSVTDSEGSAAKLVVTFDGRAWDDPVYGTTISTTDLPPDVKF